MSVMTHTQVREVGSITTSTYFVPTTIEHEALPDLRLNWASISSKVDLSVNENTYTIAEAFCLQTCNKSQENQVQYEHISLANKSEISIYVVYTGKI